MVYLGFRAFLSVKEVRRAIGVFAAAGVFYQYHRPPKMTSRLGLFIATLLNGGFELPKEVSGQNFHSCVLGGGVQLSPSQVLSMLRCVKFRRKSLVKERLRLWDSIV